MVVQRHVAHQRLLEIFTAGESVGFEYIRCLHVGDVSWSLLNQ